ncbi:MAG TPA: DUF1996 domain-containing protein [Micromonosporaceae bacterium]|jgi:hypothetical protein
MKRRLFSLAAAGTVILALGACDSHPARTAAAPTPFASSSSMATRVDTTGFPTGPHTPGIFTDRCAYSHSLADDPILAPDQPAVAMHHDFYGNTSTTAKSSAPHLVGGNTTCSTTADASAYWTPVMYRDGVALRPGTALIYWRKPARDGDSVQSVPVGLQMIAGNEAATAPQSPDVAGWTCSGTTSAKRTATPQNCPSGQDLRLVVTFPSCWDGHSLAGAGQTNVVYRTAAGCPQSHPVQIPQIVFHVNYPTSSASGLTVSMTPTMRGSTDTEHVDFINGWTQTTLNADVAACVATSTRCGPVTGSQATPQGPKMPTKKAH